MASAASCELSGEGFIDVTTHIFQCPSCHNQTKFFSTQNFICREKTECDYCGQPYLIENDVARRMTQ
jgi:hypothetical protein